MRIWGAKAARGFVAGLLFAFALVLQSSVAHSFELFGICFTGNCDAAGANSDVIDPKTYSVDFQIVSLEDSTLEKSIISASELMRGRSDPIGGSAGLIARAKGDYARILAALYNDGRYSGAISIEVNGRQAASFRPGTQLPDVNEVEIRVTPGNQFQFVEAVVRNPAPVAENRNDYVDPPLSVGFAAGEPAKAGVVRSAGELAREAWRQQGFPTARVERQEVTAIHPDHNLKVYLWMAQGPRAVYGDVTVEGVDRMDPAFVKYMAGLIEGAEFDPDDLEKARKRLERLGVFSRQRLIEADAVNSNGTLPITILTTEKKLRRVGVGATLSSIDGAGVEAFWLHRNLFGKAESLRLEGKIGGLGTTLDYEKVDYLVGASFTKPGIFSPDIDLNISATAKREYNDSYTETSVGAVGTLKHYYSDELTFTGGLFAEYGEYDDVFGTRELFTTGIIADATYDGRDNRLEPSKGFYAQLEARPFYEWEFESAGLHLQAEGRVYIALQKKKRTVVAARVKFGSLAGVSVNEAPSNLLFYAGGGGSVRGYGYKNIGVEQANGTVAGGRSLFEGSLEVRQRITGNFGAVAFADFGLVGADSVLDFSEDVKVGVGAGLRYYTGLGAIRLDVAVPLDQGKDDPDFGIYVGIGQAF
ncbi:MAG: autotransporter assembly complex family protein [Hyphomicrobiales bacterium]